MLCFKKFISLEQISSQGGEVYRERFFLGEQ